MLFYPKEVRMVWNFILCTSQKERVLMINKRTLHHTIKVVDCLAYIQSYEKRVMEEK